MESILDSYDHFLSSQLFSDRFQLENSVIILFTFGLRLQETIDGWIPDATPDLIFGILLMISMSFAYESYSFDPLFDYLFINDFLIIYFIY